MSGLITSTGSVLNLQSILFGLVIGGLAYYWFTKRKYKLPPGPSPIPLLGNVSIYTSRSFCKDLFKLTEEYGPVIKIQIGMSQVVVLNHISLVTEAMVTRQTDFASRPVVHSSELLSDGGKDIGFARYSPTLQYHRKVAAKALRYYMRGSILDTMVNETATLILDNMSKETGPFEPRKYLTKIVGYSLFRMCFGVTCAFDDPELQHFISVDERHIEALGNGIFEDKIPFMKDLFPSKRYKILVECLKQRNNIVLAKVNEHKKTFNEHTIRDFTDSILLARAEEEKAKHEDNVKRMTDDYVVQIVSDILFAGTTTSRMTLNWFIHCMAAEPDIQSQCHRVIDRVVGKDRFPVSSDRVNLGYIEACLYESMRIGTSVPMGLPHETTCDTKVGGYDVPKGTTVLINHWALHHDPKMWVNVDQFDPNRYLDAEGKLGSKPESWLPFSIGRRACLGEAASKLELLLICTRLLQRFVFRFPTGVTSNFEDNKNPSGLEPAEYDVIIKDRMYN